jgi:hypothetical protein
MRKPSSCNGRRHGWSGAPSPNCPSPSAKLSSCTTLKAWNLLTSPKSFGCPSGRSKAASPAPASNCDGNWNDGFERQQGNSGWRVSKGRLAERRRKADSKHCRSGYQPRHPSPPTRLICHAASPLAIRCSLHSLLAQLQVACLDGLGRARLPRLNSLQRHDGRFQPFGSARHRLLAFSDGSDEVA